MNASYDDEGNIDEDAPRRHMTVKILMLILIMRDIIMRLPLTHIQTI